MIMKLELALYQRFNDYLPKHNLSEKNRNQAHRVNTGDYSPGHPILLRHSFPTNIPIL